MRWIHCAKLSSREGNGHHSLSQHQATRGCLSHKHRESGSETPSRPLSPRCWAQALPYLLLPSSLDYLALNLIRRHSSDMGTGILAYIRLQTSGQRNRFWHNVLPSKPGHTTVCE